MANKKRRTVKRKTVSADASAEHKHKTGKRFSSAQKNKVTDIGGYRKRKRRAGNTRWVRVLLLFIICIVAGYYFSLSSFFEVKEIVVEGNVSVSKEAVLRSSGINIGDNIFAVSLEKAEQWTKINYMISEADIVKELPNKILITVRERTAVAIVPVDGGFLQVDKDGVVIDRSKEMDNPQLPLLTGLDAVAPGTVLGAKIYHDLETGESAASSGNKEKCLAALSVANQMNGTAREFITEINAANTQKIVIYTKDNTEVRIGSQADFAQKFEAFYALLAAQEKEGLLPTISYVDISLVSSPAIFYVK